MLDILINNVGAGRMLPFEAIDDEMWHRTFELNLFAMIRTCRELLPLMQETAAVRWSTSRPISPGSPSR